MQTQLAQALADIRKERGMTERQLADMLGISHTMLQYIRTGQRNPGRRVIKAISLKFPELNGLLLDFITK